ncbi:TPA: hypothetical protein JTN57_001300 [Escherichia coli]|nr:hypothetical protein [Escherichia coli]
MPDIIANVVISMPSQLFTLSRSFKANANGKIYISKIDTPPGEMTNPANSIQVYMENEDGSLVPVAQPLIINAAGYPVYNGQIAKFVTTEGHAMAIYNTYNSQEFYFPNVLKYDPDQLEQRLSSPEDGNGDALIAVKQPYDGTVPRTQHDFNEMLINILDWLGQNYSSTTNASPRFLAAHTALPKSKSIIVPPGAYLLETDVICKGRVFIFEEPVSILGEGRLNGALIHRYHEDGSRSYGVGETLQYSSKYRFGGTDNGPCGLQIGGGEPERGTEGNVIFPDGYGGWSVIQPSRYGSSAELAIQPSDIVGVMKTISGTPFIDYVSGEAFTDEMIDRRIYFAGFTYRVKSIQNATRIELMNVNGSDVTFNASMQYSWQQTGVITSSKVLISGVNVSLISGEPFVPMTNTEYIAQVGAERIPVTSVSTPDSITLYTAPLLQGEQVVNIFSSVDDISSAVRIHKSTGFDSEENITIAAYASGKYQIHAGSSGSDQYPLIMGCQWDSVGGDERAQISLNPNGDTVIGGKNGTLRIPYNESKNASRLRLEGNDFGEAYLSAEGNSDNIDVYIATKGTGHVGFGKYQTQGVGSIVGYIEVKDGEGNIRKLAVIS